MKIKLIKFLEHTNFFSNKQFGFRKGLNTESALQTFLDNVYKGLNPFKKVSGLFLDIKKAFDTVDHKLLLKKLANYGIRGNVYKWFESYLVNRKQSVRINSTYSQKGNV